MPSPRVGFRAIGDLEWDLEVRRRDEEAVGAVAQRDLQRYYALLSAELRRTELSLEEASLVCDALNGVWLLERPESLPTILWAEVDDAIRLNQLDEKWNVGKPAVLVAKLRNLSPAAAIAVVDAVERWWRADWEDDMDREASLREVGLVRGE